jgi:transcriptional regulator with XRE-family HTH domain
MVKNLRVLRNKKGISQLQLAEIVGVSQQSVNKYENHGVEPDIGTLIKIADYFSTSVDYLIGHTAITPDNVHEYGLNKNETLIIDGYRLLNDKEKDSIHSVISNYNAKK